MKLFLIIGCVFLLNVRCEIDLSEITNLHAQIAEVSRTNGRMVANVKPLPQKSKENSMKVPQLVDHLKTQEINAYSLDPLFARSLFDSSIVLESQPNKLVEKERENPEFRERKLIGRILASKKGAVDEVVVKFEDIGHHKSKKLTEFTKGRKLLDGIRRERRLLDYSRRLITPQPRYLKPVPPKFV